MADTLIVQAPLTIVDFEIAQDEDWYEPLPPLYRAGAPLDLTGKTLELYIRPSYSHATLLKKLSSATAAPASRIIVDTAAAGLASLYMTQADVLSLLPVSTDDGWRHFLLLTDPSGAYPADEFEYFRGRLVVRAGKRT